MYAGADATCMACRTTYSSRLRLLDHLCDPRLKCWQYILDHPRKCPALPEDEVVRLDAIDQAARTLAKKSGLQRPLSTRPAITKSGRCIGKVRQ